MDNIIIILEDIRSVLNVGNIIRSADGAGIKNITGFGVTPDINNNRVVKTSLGAENGIKWMYSSDKKEYLRRLKEDGYKIISIEIAEGSENIFDYKAGTDSKEAFIFGNEVTGVSKEALDLSDEILHLPMDGLKNSLNVSNTAAIVFYLLKYKRQQN